MNILALMHGSANLSQIAALTSVSDRTANVLPSSTIDDMTNGGLSYFIRLGKLVVTFARCKSVSYLNNLKFVQSGTTVLRATAIKAVITSILPITLAGVPAQIVQAIIGMIRVIVTALHTFGTRTDECFENKPGDKAIVWLSIFPKRDTQPAFMNWLWFPRVRLGSNRMVV